MNVKDLDLVIVRGINSEWFKENFSQLWIGFGGTPQATPKEDAYYVGLYMGDPVSEITHIGIVDDIIRPPTGGADFHLKSIIKLAKPINPDHPIRKHENWSLTDFGLNQKQMDALRSQLDSI